MPAAAYEAGWLMTTSPQSLSGRVVLATVKSGAVTVATGVKIQGVDISRLLMATINVNEDAVVASPVKFSENVLATSVWVGGAVQGWNLSSEAILQNSSSVVFISRKTFLDAFHVSGTLTAPKLGETTASSFCGERSRRNILVIAGKYFI